MWIVVRYHMRISVRYHSSLSPIMEELMSMVCETHYESFVYVWDVWLRDTVKKILKIMECKRKLFLAYKPCKYLYFQSRCHDYS